jgi:hypothetical protein
MNDTEDKTLTNAFLHKLFPNTEDDVIGDFDIYGLDESAVVAYLGITWPELRHWQGDGRFPPTNATVLKWVWKSAGRYKKLKLVEGWTREAAEAVKPHLQSWRDALKEHRKQYSRNRRIITKLEEQTTTA